MFFNSIDYALFLPIVFVLYWCVTARWLRLQNGMLLVVSYFFYACWDWRFLFLLAFSTVLDYWTGLRIHRAKDPRRRKAWLILSVGVNLGFLGLFKYYDFFITSFAGLAESLGLGFHPALLRVVLPVGISFYTFHGLSYVFDIYRNRTEPRTDPVNYALFVSFFPLLVAGPIERATHLLPQLEGPRRFNAAQAVDGLRQILWGLFKKTVIADNCAERADAIFNNSGEHSGAVLLLGAFFFAVQIYGDFSGYSDIALGSARLLGIELLRNFAFPYFSRDIAEFWRRWHISLSSWFRDYLYVPLGGSRAGRWAAVRNTFIIFLVSGLWHGANWTFIAWGAVNALYFMPLLLRGHNRRHLDNVAAGKVIPSVREFWQMGSTFLLTLLAWVFFRAADLPAAFAYLHGLFTGILDLYTYKAAAGLLLFGLGPTMLALLAAFFALEWAGRERAFALAELGQRWRPWVRWGFYYAVVLCILQFSGPDQQFIYFQF